MNKLRATEIYRDTGHLLIAIESVNRSHVKTGAGYRMYGSIEPAAIIVCSADGAYALDMESGLIDLEQLRHDIPGLGSLVGSFTNKAGNRNK